MLLQNIKRYTLLLISIGISDSIEFFTNRLVHEIHNCPDIIKKKWNEYNLIDAFVSGIYCAWMPLLLLLLIPISNNIVSLLFVINIIIPLIIDCSKDTFLCQKYLYFENTLGISIGIIIFIVEKYKSNHI